MAKNSHAAFSACAKSENPAGFCTRAESVRQAATSRVFHFELSALPKIGCDTTHRTYSQGLAGSCYRNSAGIWRIVPMARNSCVKTRNFLLHASLIGAFCLGSCEKRKTGQTRFRKSLITNGIILHWGSMLPMLPRPQLFHRCRGTPFALKFACRGAIYVAQFTCLWPRLVACSWRDHGSARS